MPGFELWEENSNKRGLNLTKNECKIIAKGFNYESVDSFMLAIAEKKIDVIKAIDYAFYRMSDYAYPSKGRGKNIAAAKLAKEETQKMDFKVSVSKKQPALNEILMLIINSRTVTIRRLELKIEQGVLSFEFTIASHSDENLKELFKHIENTSDVKSLVKSD